MILEKLLSVLLGKYDIEEKDIEKLKKVLEKVKFVEKDGKSLMVIEIGEGIELTIVQKKQ
jgi:hypothetical protein